MLDDVLRMIQHGCCIVRTRAWYGHSLITIVEVTMNNRYAVIVHKDTLHLRHRYASTLLMAQLHNIPGHQGASNLNRRDFRDHIRLHDHSSTAKHQMRVSKTSVHIQIY